MRFPIQISVLHYDVILKHKSKMAAIWSSIYCTRTPRMKKKKTFWEEVDHTNSFISTSLTIVHHFDPEIQDDRHTVKRKCNFWMGAPRIKIHIISPKSMPWRNLWRWQIEPKSVLRGTVKVIQSSTNGYRIKVLNPTTDNYLLQGQLKTAIHWRARRLIKKREMIIYRRGGGLNGFWWSRTKFVTRFRTKWGRMLWFGLNISRLFKHVAFTWGKNIVDVFYVVWFESYSRSSY